MSGNDCFYMCEVTAYRLNGRCWCAGGASRWREDIFGKLLNTERSE